MSKDVDIYAAVLQRLVEVDHGWGKPYAFHVLYVLDHAVPGVDDPRADLDGPTPEHPFDEGLRLALRAKMADLPALTFVPAIDVLHEVQPTDALQMRDGGSVALHSAGVGVMFFGRYGGRRWIRWLRYHLEPAEDSWQVTSSQLLAVT